MFSCLHFVGLLECGVVQSAHQAIPVLLWIALFHVKQFASKKDQLRRGVLAPVWAGQPHILHLC